MAIILEMDAFLNTLKLSKGFQTVATWQRQGEMRIIQLIIQPTSCQTSLAG